MKVPGYLLLLSAFGLLLACSKADSDCKGPEQEGVMCTQEYDPVCGCDGKTYGNACAAQVAGVKQYTVGECGNGK